MGRPVTRLPTSSQLIFKPQTLLLGYQEYPRFVHAGFPDTVIRLLHRPPDFPQPPPSDVTSSPAVNPSVPTPPPSMAAVLVAEPETAGLRLLGLPLLDRLLVAAHRAGFSPITVVSTQPLPALPRATAWKVPFQLSNTTPPISFPTLYAFTSLHVPVQDLRQLRSQGGRLVTPDHSPLPAGILDTQPGPGTDPWKLLPTCRTGPVARRVTDPDSARVAGEALWASLNSSVDGAVDRWFNRPVGRFLLSRWLIHTSISPNQISVGATGLGLLAGALFAVGSPRISILAAILFQISAIVDCVDGDVARAVFKESPLGKWLDIVGDQVVHAAVFAGIAVGLWRQVPDAPFLWLGGSAVLGGILSFLVVLRTLRNPALAHGPLQTLIDKATNRDFSVLVLGLACFHRLDWFLWLTAVGSHVFWIIALAIQSNPTRSPKRPA